MIKITRIAIVFFALTTLIFSLMASDELVLLARTSFAGTALMAPMIFTAIFANKNLKMALPLLTLLGMLLFIGSLMGIVPKMVLGVRMDLFLVLSLTASSLVLYHFIVKKDQSKTLGASGNEHQNNL